MGLHAGSASSAATGECTVAGTTRGDRWTVARTPAAPGEIAQDAVVCGGGGDDEVRTPELPFTGTFIGGDGDDAVGSLARHAVYRGGPGADRVRRLRGGTFRGGGGGDLVESIGRGVFSGGSGANVTPHPAVALARDELSRRADVAQDRIRLVSVAFVRWPDASLGCPEDGRFYAQSVTPGYRVRLAVGTERRLVHTDSGTRAVLVPRSGCRTAEAA